MVRTLFLALALPAIASAAVCTEADFLPLATGIIACSAASGVTPTTLQGSATPADIVKMCQFPACQTFFSSFSSLKCTDAAGNSVSQAGAACSLVGKAATTVPATTVKSSGLAITVLSTGAVIVAAAATLV
ncbi:hypothetical protein DYB37_003369 [Aphanomyces astaci]|uniref:Uncharacterized protein n=1 Tax=Aphanomyces astaci TaxID=112090 RepID=A0A397DB03_APHAT|nr:hypothetical protein AaE_003782 [Aphanomyces astaci]RHY13725.1 hypothetical protein DYB36_004565 [Aphanomyces astaci]RHY19093.1 hypothetical protein DYB25_002429 [Aphanomyces astaci]RHY61322.1 hypothetical protein DYB30_002159 [Aphanomyces astaci]RHY69006.1 hypothetical protein DYB34_002903 [Aphanomyces astaci]